MTLSFKGCAQVLLPEKVRGRGRGTERGSRQQTKWMSKPGGLPSLGCGDFRNLGLFWGVPAGRLQYIPSKSYMAGQMPGSDFGS